MADPTLKIRISGDLKDITQALAKLQTDLKQAGGVALSTAKATSEGFNQARVSINGATDALAKQSAAARTAARDQARLSREAEVARAKAARDADAAAKKAQRDAEQAVRRQSARNAQLAPQLTDISVGLATGQSPLMVLLQQGGQLRDLFGGIRPAIQAVGGAVLKLVNPITLSAGAVALLAAAYLKGRGEAERFNRVLALTGSVSGETTDRLQDAARALDNLNGSTIGSASDTLAQIVESGQFVIGQIEAVARAAEQLRNTTGKDVSATVAEFSKLAGDPTAAVNELNRKYGFLNGQLLTQIRSLQEQGRQQEAATLAINAYANAIDQRTPKVRENLGIIQRGWKSITEASREAVDAALNIGRESTGREKFDTLFAEKQRLLEEQASGGQLLGDGSFLRDNAQIQAARRRRIDQINTELLALSDANIKAEREAGRAQAQARAVELQGQLADEARQYEAAAEKRKRVRVAIENKANEAIAAARLAGDAAAEQSAKDSRARVLAALDKEEAEDNKRRLKDRQEKAERDAKAAAAIVGIDQGLVRDSAKRALDQLDQFYADGKVRLQDYFREKARLEAASIDAQVKAAQAELAAATTLEDRKRIEAELIVLERDRADIGIRAANGQREAEERLARSLEDLKARTQQAEGDRVAIQMLELRREREKLQREFANDPEALRWIDRLFDASRAQIKLDDIQQRAADAVRRMQDAEQTAGARVDAGGDPAIARADQKQARTDAIADLTRLRAELAALPADTVGAQEALASLDQTIGQIGQKNLTGIQQVMIGLRQQLLELSDSFAGEAFTSLRDGIANFFTNIANGSKGALDSLKDFVRGFAQQMAALAARALATFLLLSTLDAIYPGLGKATAAALGVNSSVKHGGGMVGSGMTRNVHPAVFAAAPRYHTGGIAGLKPNEVPAILQRGEEVLTKNDPRHASNNPGAGTRVVNVFDPSFVPNQMDSAAGERVILNVIGRNPGRVQQLLG